MRDVLTEEELWTLTSPFSGDIRERLQAAARLGAERAMQAPDGDLPAMLEQLPRLKDWYAIGPAQRAEVDTLVGWVREREMERAARVCDTWQRTHILEECCDQAQNAALVTVAEAIRRGEEG